MTLARIMTNKLSSLRNKELCPSLLNIYFGKYSIVHCLNDIFSGIKIFLLLFPILISLAIFCGGSPIQGVISGCVAMFVSALMGGSKYQISSIAFPICVLTTEIMTRYQYKGLLITSVFVCVILYILGQLRISEILRYTSNSFLSALSIYVALIVFVTQMQYILGVNTSSPYQSFLGNISILKENIKSITPTSIYNCVAFIGPLLLLRVFIKGYMSFIIYLTLNAAIMVCSESNLILLPDEFLSLKTIGQGLFNELNSNNIFKISYTLPSQVVLGNMINFAFAISLVIASQASFCTNVAASITGDNRTQTNIELISSGIANFISVSCGGFFISPDVLLSVKNIQFKSKSIIPMIVITMLGGIVLFFKDNIFKYIPVFSISSILIVLALHIIFNSEILKYCTSRSSDGYIFLTTLGIALYFGFIPAVFIGFVLSILIFTRRMIRIKDASVHTTKNHDVSAVEFMSNKYGYLTTQKIPSKILDRIEIIQINNVLFLNLVAIVRETFTSRGSFPSVIIIYFKNVPFLDGEALKMLREFVKKATKMDCIVIVSGTNGILLDILQKKTQEYNSGNIFGYIVPNFSEAIQQTLKRLKLAI